MLLSRISLKRQIDHLVTGDRRLGAPIVTPGTLRVLSYHFDYEDIKFPMQFIFRYRPGVYHILGYTVWSGAYALLADLQANGIAPQDTVARDNLEQLPPTNVQQGSSAHAAVTSNANDDRISKVELMELSEEEQKPVVDTSPVAVPGRSGQLRDIEVSRSLITAICC